MTHRLSFTSDWKPAAACPAAWHAQRVAGVYSPAPKECYAAGSLFHAVLLTPDRVPAVYAEYGEFLTLSRSGKSGAKGEPNAKARDAITDAAYARSRPEIAELLAGARCETEVQFDLDGIPWIAHVDLITAHGCVCDAKTCKDIEGTEWSAAVRQRVPWHEAMLYWHQLAVYRRALGTQEPAVAIIACQHCEDGTPDVRIIERSEADDDILDRLASDVVWSMRHEWESPLTGIRLPSFADMLDMPADLAQGYLPRCETCEWCRRSRRSLYFPYAARRERGV